MLLFILVYFCFTLARCWQACPPQPNEANLNLQSSDPVGRGESETFPLPLFPWMFSFGSFASHPHPVLSPALCCFRLAGCPLGRFVSTQCWGLTPVLFFACSCFRLWFCILVSMRLFCFVAFWLCSRSFADYCLFCSGCPLFRVWVLKFCELDWCLSDCFEFRAWPAAPSIIDISASAP